MKQRLSALCLLAVLVVVLAPVPSSAQGDGVPRITLAEFKALQASASPPFIIDVRGQIDRKIVGAHHIPYGEIEARLAEIPRDRPIVTYCS